MLGWLSHSPVGLQQEANKRVSDCWKCLDVMVDLGFSLRSAKMCAKRQRNVSFLDEEGGGPGRPATKLAAHKVGEKKGWALGHELLAGFVAGFFARFVAGFVDQISYWEDGLW
jgi:hypothetical protein